MKNLTKLVAIGAVGLMMTACSSTYKIKSEKGKVMNTVPKWYMADYSESKACDTPWLGKDKDKMCIFGVATAVSPDLQLAIEKGKMLAKSELADIIAGEMNKESKQFITELGKTNTKTVSIKERIESQTTETKLNKLYSDWRNQQEEIEKLFQNKQQTIPSFGHLLLSGLP